MAGDPHWDKVVLAMHMDGANASTVFTDLKGKVVTAVGNAQISTAQSKFGGASALFDGSGDYLSVGTIADDAFSFPGDFTIELSVRQTAYGAYSTLLSSYGGARTGAYLLRVDASGYANFYLHPAGVVMTSSIAIALNTWNHIAVTRAGSTLFMFINGVIVATRTDISIGLLIRPDEVLSRIFDVPVLKIADNALRRLLQHRHMFCRRLT